MANTYDYIVNDLTVDQNGIVLAAAFTVVADDGTDSYAHPCYTAFANTPQTPTPFANITEAKVVGWIRRDEGATGGIFRTQADAELEAYKLRKTVQVTTPAVPWVKRQKPGNR